ncbi:MAG: hypothetical protein Kow00121_20070 [Elainellaceae cyanobacterium]
MSSPTSTSDSPATQITSSLDRHSSKTTISWQQLVEFGVPAKKARAFAKAIEKYYASQHVVQQRRSIEVRKLIAVYWRKLIEVGIPIDDAHRVAEAIAWLDAAQKALTPAQKRLIRYYCVMICRAELWRSGMLLQS